MEFCWEQAHETLDLLDSRKGNNEAGGKKRKGTVGKDVARRNKTHKRPWALPLVGAKYTLPKSPGKAWVEGKRYLAKFGPSPGDVNSDLTRIGDPHWDSPDIRDVPISNLDFVPLVLFAEHRV